MSTNNNNQQTKKHSTLIGKTFCVCPITTENGRRRLPFVFEKIRQGKTYAGFRLIESEDGALIPTDYLSEGVRVATPDRIDLSQEKIQMIISGVLILNSKEYLLCRVAR